MQMEKANMALYGQLNLNTVQRAALRALWLRWLASRKHSQHAFAAATATAEMLPTVAAVPTATLAAIAAVAAGDIVPHRMPDMERWATRLVGVSAAATSCAAATVSALRDELHRSSAQFVAMTCAISNMRNGFTVDQTHWLMSMKLDSAAFSIDRFRLCQLAAEEAKRDSRRSSCPIA
jgi:hypothetical protein